MKAEVLIDKKLVFNNSKYVADLKVYKVAKSNKFPKGIKAKFVLFDVKYSFVRLLIDNHEPHGFHMHTHLPEDKEIRLPLETDNHNEALNIFFKEVERIIQDEG